MKKRIMTCLLIAAMLVSFVPTAYAVSTEAYNAAGVLNNIGLFKGTGTKSDGSPEFDLGRAPARDEAVTMLVRLLGKETEAKNGTWDMPFNDVAEWAKPYVGYAYANGLTSGTSATTFGGSQTVTATQYLTFVLRALGYDSSVDFAWDKAWELSDKIGMTDGEYKAGGTFLRGDVAIVSRNALDVKQKDKSETLAEKLIREKVFTKEQYKNAGEETKILVEEPLVVPNVAFEIEGYPLITDNDIRVEAGTYLVTPYLRDELFDNFEVQVERGTGTVTKNADGTFTVKYPAKDNCHIALFYDPQKIEKTEPDGTKTSYISWTKRSLAFNTPIPDEGIVFAHGDSTFLPGKSFGGPKGYYVVDVFYNGERITDFTVTADAGAPFTVKLQADGTVLVMRNSTGSGKFTINYRGITASLGVSFN